MSSEVDKKAELRKKVEYQVACEERAFRIVERLIENPQTELVLIDALQFITPNHYSDIVEERAVSKLCGYPACGKSLSNVPKQRYAISTKTNKVYDIESRKNFCSGMCYKASLYLQTQISTAPVWSRQNQPPIKFQLLPLDSNSGCVGDEVVMGQREELKSDLNKLGKLDNFQEALNNKQLEPKDSQTSIRNLDDHRGTNINSNNSESDDGECVYTLERALDEMRIGSEVEDSERKLKDIKEEHTCQENVRHVKDSVQRKSDNLDRKVENAVVCNSKLSDKNSKSGPEPGESKTDYLMKLLDKRKNLLAQMADIQPSAAAKCQQASTQHNLQVSTCNKDLKTVSKTNVEQNSSVIVSKPNTLPSDSNLALKTNSVKDDDFTERTSTVQNNPKVLKSSTGNADHSEHMKEVSKNRGTCEIRNQAVKGQQKGTCEPTKSDSKISVSTLRLICKTIQAWITVETLEYINTKPQDEPVQNKSEYERQYKALERQVDKQEKDFDKMLGDEMLSEDDSAARPSRPLPHFEVLKQEVEEDSLRVSEFLKGSLTYTVEERKPLKSGDNSHEIVLPTVDRYDQMLIRQRIVLDRISKVLPDLLKPLHLLIQHVFTDFRELVFTFNLTKDNILFQPAEWIVVTLVLLKLISVRNTGVRTGFDSPEAKKYFSIILKGAGSNLEELDNCVLQLKLSERR